MNKQVLGFLIVGIFLTIVFVSYYAIKTENAIYSTVISLGK